MHGEVKIAASLADGPQSRAGVGDSSLAQLSPPDSVLHVGVLAEREVKGH